LFPPLQVFNVETCRIVLTNQLLAYSLIIRSPLQTPEHKAPNHETIQKMPKGIRLLTKDEQESLLEDISNGKAVATWCREHDTQNSKVYVTLREDNSFLQSYSHARENQADSFVEKIFDVCHKLELREIDPHSARVIIDTLKWSAGKLKPKAWGDNQVLTVNVNGKLSMIDYLIKQQTAIEGDYAEH
jgi:hypothetical protein